MKSMTDGRRSVALLELVGDLNGKAIAAPIYSAQISLKNLMQHSEA